MWPFLPSLPYLYVLYWQYFLYSFVENEMDKEAAEITDGEASEDEPADGAED